MSLGLSVCGNGACGSPGAEEGVLVTASHAIFKEDGPKKAPAAVVGFQFYHSALQTLFNKTTTTVRSFFCVSASLNV